MVGFLTYFKGTGYADELDMGCEKKKDVKNDFRVSD